MKNGLTIRDAAERWVHEMNAIPQGMIEKLMNIGDGDIHEVTEPAVGDSVYFYADLKGSGDGEITGVDNKDDGVVYTIELLCCHDGGASDNTIRDIQGLLGHADVRVTMKYLKETTLRYDAARKEVSDFVLGRTDVNELVITQQKNNDDVYKVCMEILEKVA